jgi:hypothetical protein
MPVGLRRHHAARPPQLLFPKSVSHVDVDAFIAPARGRFGYS